MSERSNGPRIPMRFFGIFAIFAFVILGAERMYYRAEQIHVRAQAANELTSVAQLKTHLISDWIVERIADAKLFYNYPLFVQDVQKCLSRPRSKEKDELLESWFSSLKESHRYRSIYLLEVTGVLCWKLGTPADPDSVSVREGVANALSNGNIQFSELMTEKSTRLVYLDIFIPLRNSAHMRSNPVGVLVFEIDVERDLFSFVQSWSTENTSSETVLVRREGSEVAYLNELRHRKGTALLMRTPLSQKQLPAVMAVEGREGMQEGIDYRGKPVFFVAKRVGETPWFLVAKTDQKEILAPMKKRQLAIVLLDLSLLFMGGLIVWASWRHQQADFYQAQYEAKIDMETVGRQLHLQSTALNSAANAIVITDRNGRISWVNAAFSNMTGYSFEEAVGNLPSVLKSGRHDASFYKTLWDTILAGIPWHGAIVNRRKDGTFYDEEMTITPVYDDSKQISHFIAIKQDITERRRTEEALQTSEKKYRKFFEEDISGDYISTPEGRLLACNSAFLRIFGFSTIDEALAIDMTALYPSPDARKNLLQLLREKKKLGRHEMEFRKRDGTVIFAIQSCFGIFDEKGDLVQIIGYIFDDTQGKKLEAQFLQSQKMEAVGRLAGGIAHDFNNLLTVISGYSALSLMRLGANDPLRRNVEEIKKAGDRAGALTRQLLAFSRRQVLQPKVFDLNAVILDLEKMLRRLIGEDIELQFVPAPALGQVKADPGQIEQVIMNLVVNARDAMPRGGKLTLETTNMVVDELFVRTHAGLTPGSYVLLSVSDTGCGMNPEVLSHLFEPFFTTKEQEKGTGLGLSTVYGIVKQSNGYINVYSEEGVGTTFKVYLPHVNENIAPSKRQGSEEVRVTGDEVILLVEDDASVRSLSREILEGFGYTVLEASNGQEALQICRGHAGLIHLMVTDVVMPKISGRELAEAIQKIRPEIKLLFVSGYTEDAIVHHDVLRWGTSFLQKPFVPTTLAEKVREVLDQKA